MVMFGDIMFTIICMLYFAGGIGIGYYVNDWRKTKKSRGDGRWD
jgi:hypothetical protein